MLLDDGRLLPLALADVAELSAPLTLVRAAGRASTLSGTWPQADCRLREWAVAEDDGSGMPAERRDELIAVAADTESRLEAGQHANGVQARAERRRLAERQIGEGTDADPALVLELALARLAAAIDVQVK